MTTLNPTCCLPTPAGRPTFRFTAVTDWLLRPVATWTRWQRTRPWPARVVETGHPDALGALADYPPHLLRDVGLAPTHLALLERQAALRALRWQAHLG